MSKRLPKQKPKEVNKRFFAPLRRLIKMNYFRFKVRGANHIPTEGEILFVANHSGWVAIDALFLMMAVHDTAGPAFLPYIIVHDVLTTIPLTRQILKDLGAIPASMLHYGREPLPPEINPIAIFPEGADGNSKPFWKAYHMQPWKSGFVRLAIQRKAKVVPVVLVGGEESVPVAATIDALKPLLGSVMPLPLTLLPLSSRWKVEFLEPIDFSSYDPAIIHDQERCREIAREIHDLVQEGLNRNARRRPLTWLSNLIDRDEDEPAILDDPEDTPRSHYPLPPMAMTPTASLSPPREPGSTPPLMAPPPQPLTPHKLDQSALSEDLSDAFDPFNPFSQEERI